MFTVSEMLFTILEGFIIIYTFALLSGFRENVIKEKFKYICFVTIYTIYTYWISLFVPAGFHTLIILILTVAVLNYIFNGKIYKSLIKVFLITSYVTIIETVVAMFALLATNIPMSELLKNSLYVLICSIISKTVEFLGLFVFYKKPVNLAWLNDSNPYQSKYKQILIIISTVLIFFVYVNIFLSGQPQKAYLFNLFSFIIYLVLMVAMFSAFREGSKLELLQYANEMQKDSVRQLIDFNEMVAKERHEYKNHLNTIFGLCTLNKPDSTERIKHYINNFANNSSTKNISTDSGNDFVDAIINVKYNSAFRRGIELRADFEEPLSSAGIAEDMAVTVISNIIDNAFDAMNNVDSENKFVHLWTYIKKDRYFISISNNGPMIPEANRNKIFNAGYSTKDNPSKTRGFGLSIVQNELTRCNGDIKINSTEELTEFLISCTAKGQQPAV